MEFTFKPVGIVRSPFKQKFAIPRQPRLVEQAMAQLEMLAPFNTLEAFNGIEQFSHLWITFVFHQTMAQGWSNQVRPPRLGGNVKIGVFATRSTFRPNPIGLSAVSFHGLVERQGKLFLQLGGVDLLDGTPVIDIKPYLPYTDKIEQAKGGFASEIPLPSLPVTFSQLALSQCQAAEPNYPEIQSLIAGILAQDPRPAYKKEDTSVQEYAVFLYDFNLRWQVENNQCLVLSLEHNGN
jgi:tRNA (adenine37-N6)-methyltransferase